MADPSFSPEPNAVLVPLSLASLVTGLVCALGSTWGLFRHFWVLFKLAINLVATTVLLLYMQILDYLADVAAHTTTLPPVSLAGCGTHCQCCTLPPPARSCWWPQRWPSSGPGA